eukprot:3659399-Amphidinium_carterae.1
MRQDELELRARPPSQCHSIVDGQTICYVRDACHACRRELDEVSKQLTAAQLKRLLQISDQ